MKSVNVIVVAIALMWLTIMMSGCGTTNKKTCLESPAVIGRGDKAP